jgi:hypothetical protein
MQMSHTAKASQLPGSDPDIDNPAATLFQCGAAGD